MKTETNTAEPTCACGDPAAEWRGDGHGRRDYTCAGCHATQTASRTAFSVEPHEGPHGRIVIHTPNCGSPIHVYARSAHEGEAFVAALNGIELVDSIYLA